MSSCPDGKNQPAIAIAKVSVGKVVVAVAVLGVRLLVGGFGMSCSPFKHSVQCDEHRGHPPRIAGFGDQPSPG